MPGGRPSGYNEEIQAKAEEYLEKWDELGQVVPTVAGLSLYIDIPNSTIYDWKAKFPEFSGTLEKLQKIQEMRLVSRGLKNEFNPTITKLMLANHDYSEKQSIDHTSSDETMKPTVVTLVGKRADESND